MRKISVNSPPACLENILKKISEDKSERRIQLSITDDVMNSRLKNSLILSTVDTEEIAAVISDARIMPDVSFKKNRIKDATKLNIPESSIPHVPIVVLDPKQGLNYNDVRKRIDIDHVRCSREDGGSMTASSHNEMRVVQEDPSDEDFIASKRYFGLDARISFFEQFKDMRGQMNIYSGNEALTADKYTALGNTFKDDAIIRRKKSTLIASMSKLDAAGLSYILNNDNDDDAHHLATIDPFGIVDDVIVASSANNFYSSRSVTKTPAPSTFDLQGNVNNGGAFSPENLRRHSPRTRYLGNCIRENVIPMPSLVLRKDPAAKILKQSGHSTADEYKHDINLSHFNLGDKVGLALADCLGDLPSVHTIDFSDNNLTDKSLSLLLQSMIKLRTLQYLDLSKNKIDLAASQALKAYLAMPECNLVSLVLQNADIDDYECDTFMQSLCANASLRSLDLSNNLLGRGESRQDKAFNPKYLSNFIESEHCRLHTLKLSWNSIRLQLAVNLVKSLSVNKTITYLDLSYNNGLDQTAGEILGDAIESNTTLQTLILSSNNINSNSCFTLCAALLETKSVSKVVLDSNPIGEAGVWALMRIPGKPGHSIDLSAYSCNITYKEPSFWFNYKDPKGSYTLHLEKPFDRAVALILLRLVAMDRTWIFSETLYEEFPVSGGRRGGTKKADVKKLKLIPSCVCLPDSELGGKKLDMIRNLQRIERAADDMEHALQLFMETDTDNSGELDSRELERLFMKLGVYESGDRVAEAMSVFDVDNSGVLEIDEFVDFINLLTREAKERIGEMRKFRYFVLENNQTERYVPPRFGILKLTVVDSFLEKEDYHVFMEPGVTLSLCSSLGSYNHALHAIQNSALPFNTAWDLFKALNSDHANVGRCLAQILPHLSHEADAQNLLFKATQGDRSKIKQVKLAVGPALRPLTGLLNGFYSLDMSNPLDRSCFSVLLGRSIVFNRSRGAKWSPIFGSNVVGDVSQKGNWTAFRNEMLDGVPFEVTLATCTPIPTRGILEFDYSIGSKVDLSSRAVVDKRVMSLLSNLGLLDAGHTTSQEAIKRLFIWRRAAVPGENNLGASAFKNSPERASAIALAMDKFYANLPKRMEMYKQAHKAEELRVNVAKRRGTLIRQGSLENPLYDEDDPSFLDNCTNKAIDSSSTQGDFIRQGFNLETLDWGAVLASGMSEFMMPDDSPDKGRTSTKMQALLEDNSKSVLSRQSSAEDLDASSRKLEGMKKGLRGGAIRNYLQSLLNFSSTEMSDNARASRIAEIIIDAFANLDLRCRHLSLIITAFKYGGTLKTQYFGSYNVDVVVTLFPHLVDLHNFEIVLSCLRPDESAAVICRLGYLQVFNPCKPDGSIELNLERREERVIGKMYLILATAEGVNETRKFESISNVKYRLKRSEKPSPGWGITEYVLSNAGFPYKGMLSFSYSTNENISENPKSRISTSSNTTVEAPITDRPQDNISPRRVSSSQDEKKPILTTVTSSAQDEKRQLLSSFKKRLVVSAGGQASAMLRRALLAMTLIDLEKIIPEIESSAHNSKDLVAARQASRSASLLQMRTSAKVGHFKPTIFQQDDAVAVVEKSYKYKASVWNEYLIPK